ncbi:uncharacterized protein LOC141639978 [Silene latifolia]|uniref:uncharacterized protein LOC141639978 n=1 Tax=Silene latifolia TaxID=37657 RepID=UPI003D782F5B
MTKSSDSGDGKKGTTMTIPQSSPLFLHPSDNPGIMITQTVFNGDNYDNWSDAVRMGLESKNKLDFLDGKIKEPTVAKGEEETVEHVAWRQCIAMVKTWLKNVIDPKLHASIAFSGTVKEIWDELKERYATGSAPRVHQLKSELSELKQGKLTIVEYYTKLKAVWDELASYSRVPRCTCGAGKEILREKEEEKVHQFLMGLDDAVYGGLRTNLLMEEPIPALSRVYGIILREERHKAIVRSKEDKTEEAAFSVRKSQPSTRGGRAKYTGEVDDQEERCTYCNKWGHDEDDCWSKNGLLAHIISRGRGRGRTARGRGGAGRGDGRQQPWKANAVYTNQGASTSANQGTNQGSVPGVEVGLTREELQSLRALLQPTKENSEKMTGKEFQNCWILDTGASHHMTDRSSKKMIGAGKQHDGVYYYKGQEKQLACRVEAQSKEAFTSRDVVFMEHVYPMQIGDASHYKKHVTDLVDTAGLEQADYSQLNSDGDDEDELLSEEELTDDEEVVTGAGEGGAREVAASNTPSAVEELGRGAREKFEPAWRKDYICTSTTVINTIEDNPRQSKSSRKEHKELRHYGEALKDPLWRETMRQEIKELESNNTWQVVNLPIGKKPIGCKWIYKIKYKADGSVERYKARLVAQGFTQVEGIDFHETFAPVAKKKVYMRMPPGVDVEADTGSKVCRLLKSIYGLKQASRMWFRKLAESLKQYGSKQSLADYSLFTYNVGTVFMAVLIYVDDMILVGNSMEACETFKTFLNDKFGIKNLGKLKYFLGIEVAHGKRGLFLSQ